MRRGTWKVEGEKELLSVWLFKPKTKSGAAGITVSQEIGEIPKMNHSSNFF